MILEENGTITFIHKRIDYFGTITKDHTTEFFKGSKTYSNERHSEIFGLIEKEVRYPKGNFLNTLID